MRKVLVVLALVAGFLFVASPAQAYRPVPFKEYRCHPSIGCSITQVRDCYWMPTGGYVKRTNRKHAFKHNRITVVKQCSAWYTPRYSR